MTRETTATGFRTAMAAIVLACAATLPCSGVSAAPPDSPWGANYFPNISLVNQDGKTLKFYDDMIKDKVVMINFMYSACKDSCPLETAKLRQVQEELGGRVGKEIFMYSISIDPTHDTPATLKDYAAKYKVGPGWQFLTGKETEINLLRRKLGLYEEGEKRSDHGMDMVIGNEATGQWRKRSTFDNPKVLAKAVGDALFNYVRPPAGDASYTGAPTMISIDPGEDLFRRRCQVCHTVGAGDTIGPDLVGVTRARKHAWLKRWIQEPDKVLAEKDPVATALFEKYKQVVMPNLRLSDADVENLIGYLEAASAAAEGRKQAAAVPAGGHEGHEGHEGHTHHH